jgi:PAS domain S-box-containing protein
MVEQSNWQELKERIALLEKESAQRARLEAINTALFRICDAVSTATSRQELYRTIHLALSPVIDTTNFYIALYEKNDDSLTFPYIVDTVDTCYPPALHVSKTASLTAAVIRRQAPLLIRKDDIIKRQAKSGLIIPTCTPAEIWLGVPLKTPRGIIGVIAVQSYEDTNCYDQTDMNVLASVADMVAITLERKHAEDALRESEEKFRQIITTVREGIISINADRKITFANAFLAEMLGYELEELMGQSFAMLLYAEDQLDFSRRQDDREKGKIEQFERRFRTKDGQELWAIVSASPLLDGKGSIIGAFSTITDITERKKAETALQEKNLELQQAMNQIKTLRGIVPICMNCKKIRDDQGYWNQVEVYVRNHTEAEFSHGMCPDCIVKLYPEYTQDVLKEDRKT